MDHKYLNLINRPFTFWKIRLELLDHYENTIDAIERDIDSGNSASISCNNEQGIHKSCTITLANVNEKYTPDENNPFWFNRKFRLYIGIQDDKKTEEGIEKRTIFDGDTYWFAKGVFIAQSVQCDSVNKIVTISGVDKYAQLDGTLNVLQADEMETVFQINSNVKRVVTDILMLDMGNGLPLDPIEPIIDPNIATELLYKEYTLSAGQYYGDFLNELVTSFGCEIYYDNIGRLTIRRSFTDDVAYWNAFKAPSHEFENGGLGYFEPQETANLNGVNKIIVRTENIETPNASFTAINHNPQSPLCYDKIGGRTLPENGGIITINAGDIYQDNHDAMYWVTKRCKDYAEYRLMQETCTALEISFNCPMCPHINEGDIVTITDKQFNLDHDTFIVNSISFDLGNLTTQLQVVNTQYLNTDINALGDLGATGYVEVTYMIGYRITNATGITPSSTELREVDQTFATASGYDEINHFVTFYRDDYEISEWIDNVSGNTFPVGAEAQNPRRDCTLEPVWLALPTDNVFEIQIKDCAAGIYAYPTLDRTSATIEKAHDILERIDVGTRKYYLYGRGQRNDSVSIAVEGDVTFKHMIWGNYGSITAYAQLGSFMAQIIKSCSNLSEGTGYSVTLPNSLQDYDFSNVGNNMNLLKYTSIKFGDVRTIVVGNNWLNGCANLELLEFNNVGDLQISCNNDTTITILNNNSRISQIKAIGKVSFVSSFSMIVGNNTTTRPTPSLYFPNGLSLKHITFYSKSSTTNAISVEIATSSGSLNLVDSKFLQQNNIPNCNILLGEVESGGGFLKNATIKSLTFNGNVSVLANYNDCDFIYGTKYSTAGTVIFNQNVVVAGGGYFIYNTNTISTIDFKGTFALTRYLTYNVNANILCNNTSLSRINFYNSVSIASNASKTQNFIVNNALLTDIYFYNSSLVLPSDVAAFTGNNVNLTIHGIANSSVQTIAESRGIPFVALTSQELSEAGL